MKRSASFLCFIEKNPAGDIDCVFVFKATNCFNVHLTFFLFVNNAVVYTVLMCASHSSFLQGSLRQLLFQSRLERGRE